MTEDANTYPRTFAADAPLDVKVEIGAGHVSLTATDAREATVALRPARVSDGDALDLIARSTVDLRGTSLYIDVPRTQTIGFRQSAELVVDVTVPDMSTANVKTGSAGVRLSGTFGDVTIKTGSGDVHVESGAYAKVGTGSGDVSLGRVDEAWIKTGSGGIAVEAVTGDVTLGSGSGDVRLTEIDGNATISTASGNVDVRTSSGAVAVKTASGDVIVRRALAGELEVKTASGRVSVGVPDGTSVLLDCRSVSGRCRSALTPSDEPGEGDEQRLHVRARTVSGGIDITRSK